MSSEQQILALNPFDVPTGCKHTERTKLSDIKRENAYNDIINRIGWSMFEWSGLPDDLPSEEIERAVRCGAGVVYKVPATTGSVSAGMWVCTPVEWVGVRKADNTADRFVTYLPGCDFAIASEQLDDYVIIRNNFEMSNDYDFSEWTAKMLNETDISEMQLIKWSRMTPIAKVIDANDVGKMENILKRVYNGEPWAVYSDTAKLLTKSPSSRDDTVLRLTDETAIEKMHFLSEFHYELIRRLCNLHNIPFHTTAKSAQNLESELHNTDIFSRMLPEECLKYRRLACPDLSRLFGNEVSVDMGKMFKKENEVIENIIDSTAPEPEPEPEPEPDSGDNSNE